MTGLPIWARRRPHFPTIVVTLAIAYTPKTEDLLIDSELEGTLQAVTRIINAKVLWSVTSQIYYKSLGIDPSDRFTRTDIPR